MVDVKWVSVISANLVPVTRFAVINYRRYADGGWRWIKNKVCVMTLEALLNVRKILLSIVFQIIESLFFSKFFLFFSTTFAEVFA